MSDRMYIVDDIGCWGWTGAIENGRPVVWERGKKRGAARVFYEKKHKCWVDRRANVVRQAGCDPKCVNPDHARLKTNREMNEAFMDIYGAERKRRRRQTAAERVRELEERRKRFKPIIKK